MHYSKKLKIYSKDRMLRFANTTKSGKPYLHKNAAPIACGTAFSWLFRFDQANMAIGFSRLSLIAVRSCAPNAPSITR